MTSEGDLSSELSTGTKKPPERGGFSAKEYLKELEV